MSRIAPVRGTDLAPNEWDERLMLARTIEEVKALRAERLVKHYQGQHDQKDHGNWARIGAGQLDRERFNAVIDALGAPEYGFNHGDVTYGELDGKPRIFDVVREGAYPAKRVNPRPPKHIFRAISEADWQRIQEQGYIDTHGEWNLDPSEGLNAAFEPSVFYLPKVGAGRIIRIDYNDDDGWRMEERVDSYLKTDKKVPLSRVSLVTPIIEGRLLEEASSVTGDVRRVQRYHLLEPDAGPTSDEFLLTWGDIRRQYGDDWSRIEKHAAPIHPGTGTDQSVHGSGSSSRGDALNDGSPRRSGARVESVFPPVPSRLGDCYMNAAEKLIDVDGTLVHGIIRSDVYGDVAHAWLILDDGYVYEPTTDAVYHPSDFESLHNPVELARYEADDARHQLITYKHWGPWDPESEEWYDVYNSELGAGHREASKSATARVMGDE